MIWIHEHSSWNLLSSTFEEIISKPNSTRKNRKNYFIFFKGVFFFAVEFFICCIKICLFDTLIAWKWIEQDRKNHQWWWWRRQTIIHSYNEQCIIGQGFINCWIQTIIMPWGGLSESCQHQWIGVAQQKRALWGRGRGRGVGLLGLWWLCRNISIGINSWWKKKEMCGWHIVQCSVHSYKGIIWII